MRTLLSNCPVFGGKVRVVGISDGDTITVRHSSGTDKIRLHGIDCPEKGQSFGRKAKKFTSKLVYKKDVEVQVKDTDRYGRTVGTVFLPDGTNLNHELVRAGLAWWYRRYAPDDKDLKKLEKDAKINKIGLWSRKNPIPPWEFRRTKKRWRPRRSY